MTMMPPEPAPHLRPGPPGPGLHRLVCMAWLLVPLLVAGVAGADLRYCNKTPIPIYTAVGYPEGEAWFARGWWKLEPEECTTVIGGPLVNGSYYAYAESEGADFTWGDDVDFCVRQSAFKMRDRPGCDWGNSGVRRLGFSLIDIGDSRDYTLHFNCPDCRIWRRGRLLLSVPETRTSFPLGSDRVHTTLNGSVEVHPGADEVDVRLQVRGDLRDLQRKLPPLIRAQARVHEECGDRVRLHRVDVRPSGRGALVSIGGKYEHWVCWGLLGKHKTVEQGGSADLAVTPRVSGSVISAHVRLVELDAGGLLGTLMRDRFLGPWIRGQVRNAVPRMVQVADLRRLLPPELRRFRPRVQSLRFTDLGSGRLGIEVDARLTVRGEDARQVRSSLGL